jgi:hypothetical protein
MTHKNLLPDETLLDWIKQRTDGKPSSEIARDHGTTEERVRVATNRVLAADIKLCGPQVAKKYWDRTGGPKK